MSSVHVKLSPYMPLLTIFKAVVVVVVVVVAAVVVVVVVAVVVVVVVVEIVVVLAGRVLNARPYVFAYSSAVESLYPFITASSYMVFLDI